MDNTTVLYDPISLSSDIFSDAAKLRITYSDYVALEQLNKENKLMFDPLVFNKFFTTDTILLDMLIHNISWQYADVNKIVPYFGDFFGAYFYGKSPTLLNVTFSLVDLYGNANKYALMELYTKLFRASKVAIYGIIPILQFLKTTVQGVFTTLNTTEDATNPDLVKGTFQFLVLNLYIDNRYNKQKKNVSILYDSASKIEDLNVDASQTSNLNNFKAADKASMLSSGAANTSDTTINITKVK